MRRDRRRDLPRSVGTRWKRHLRSCRSERWRWMSSQGWFSEATSHMCLIFVDHSSLSLLFSLPSPSRPSLFLTFFNYLLQMTTTVCTFHEKMTNHHRCNSPWRFLPLSLVLINRLRCFITFPLSRRFGQSKHLHHFQRYLNLFSLSLSPITSAY